MAIPARRNDWLQATTLRAALAAAVLLVSLFGMTRSATANLGDLAAVVCLDPDYYREQAAHFRQVAAAVSGDEMTNQMMGLAAAYETKASQLEAPSVIGARASARRGQCS